MTGEGVGYEIRVQGHLDAHWAPWFPGMTLAHHDDGTTSIVGRPADQSELHGALARIRDLGVPLVSVTPTPLPGPLAGDQRTAYGDCIPRGGAE